MALGMIGLRVLGAVLRSDLRFRLSELFVDAPSVGVRGDGALALDFVAAYGVQGGFEFTVLGIDRVLEIARNTGAPERELAEMEQVRALGREGEPQNGRSVHHYEVRLGADGELRLNDQDLSFIMGEIIEELD